MPDPQTQTTLSQVIAYALVLLGGGAGVKGWERFRRNGSAGRDARYIVRAIEASGEKVSGEIVALAGKTEELHRDVSRLLGRSEGTGGTPR